MRDVRIGGPDRRFAAGETLDRVEHDAAEMHDREIARAQPLMRAVGDRSHRLPHRHVLIRNADDARVIAVLHRLAILQEIVVAGPDAAIAVVEIDADPRAAEFAKRVRCRRPGPNCSTR